MSRTKRRTVARHASLALCGAALMLSAPTTAVAASNDGIPDRTRVINVDVDIVATRSADGIPTLQIVERTTLLFPDDWHGEDYQYVAHDDTNQTYSLLNHSVDIIHGKSNVSWPVTLCFAGKGNSECFEKHNMTIRQPPNSVKPGLVTFVDSYTAVGMGFHDPTTNRDYLQWNHPRSVGAYSLDRIQITWHLADDMQADLLATSCQGNADCAMTQADDGTIVHTMLGTTATVGGVVSRLDFPDSAFDLRDMSFLGNPWKIATALLTAALVLLAFARAGRWYYRERYLPNKEFHPTSIPDSRIEPAHIGALLDSTSNGFAAQLVSYVIAGGGTFSYRRHGTREHMTVDVVKPTEGQSEVNDIMWNRLTGGLSKQRLSLELALHDHNPLVEARSSFDEKINAVNAHRGFRDSPSKVLFDHAVHFALAVAVLVCFGMGYGFGALFQWVQLTIPAIALIFASLFQVRVSHASAEGIALINHEGDLRAFFQSSLEDQDRLLAEDAHDFAAWEALLPWAIVTGCDAKWIGRLYVVDIPPVVPRWLTGDVMPDTDSLANALSSIMAVLPRRVTLGEKLQRIKA